MSSSEPGTLRGEPAYNEMLDANAEARYESARTVLSPLFKMFSPSSVLDVGCGHGAWLRVARELGADVVFGVDGPWVDPESLKIPKTFFRAHALETPLDLKQRYDLVISIEVAEHLPEAAADTFVETLTSHGDVILFSAAIPFQGGVNHVNEQWQDYWAQKFSGRGYLAVDCVRGPHWSDERVFWWIRQNCILYAKPSALQNQTDMENAVVEDFGSLCSVHPNLYMQWVSLAGELASKQPK